MGFEGWEVVLKNKSKLVGIIEETEENLNITMIGGAKQTVAKEDIEPRTKMKQSLMYQGLHQLMTPAELADLEVLDEALQDRATNTTRFLVIGEKTCPPTGNDRTSILFSVHDRPGSLVAALKAFDSFEINMSKIESRPSKQKDWEYIFYVDLAGHCDTEQVSSALEELEKHCSLVKLLGSYPDSFE